MGRDIWVHTVFTPFLSSCPLLLLCRAQPMRWPDFGLVHILRALLNMTPVRSFVKTAKTSVVPRWVILLTAVACAVALLVEVRP